MPIQPIQYNQNRDLAGRAPLDAYVKTQERLSQEALTNELAVDELTAAIRAEPVVPGDEFVREEKLAYIQDQLAQYSKTNDFSGARRFVSKLASQTLSDPEWVGVKQSRKAYDVEQGLKQQADFEGKPYYETGKEFQSTVQIGEDGSRSIQPYQPRARLFSDNRVERDAIFNDFKGEKVRTQNADGTYSLTDQLTPESIIEYLDAFGMDQYRATAAYQNELNEIMITQNKDGAAADNAIKDRLLTHGMERAFQNKIDSGKATGSSSSGGAGSIMGRLNKMQIVPLSTPKANRRGAVQEIAHGILPGVGFHEVDIPLGMQSPVRPKEAKLGPYKPTNRMFRLSGSEKNQAWSQNNIQDDDDDEIDYSDVQHGGYNMAFQIAGLPQGMTSIGNNENVAGDLVTFGPEGSIPRVKGSNDSINRITDENGNEWIWGDSKGKMFARFGDNPEDIVEISPFLGKILITADGSEVMEELSRQEAIEAGYQDYVPNLFSDQPPNGAQPQGPDRQVYNTADGASFLHQYGLLAQSNPVLADLYSTTVLDIMDYMNDKDTEMSNEQFDAGLRQLNLNMKNFEMLANTYTRKETE